MFPQEGGQQVHRSAAGRVAPLKNSTPFWLKRALSRLVENEGDVKVELRIGENQKHKVHPEE